MNLRREVFDEIALSKSVLQVKVCSVTTANHNNVPIRGTEQDQTSFCFI